jgi:hypothetical protein
VCHGSHLLTLSGTSFAISIIERLREHPPV